MTKLRTLRRRIDGAYDHWKKWMRLRNAAKHSDHIRLRGRARDQHLRSAIARRIWVVRTHRQPFTMVHE